MLVNQTLSIGVLGLALCACGDNGKNTAALDAPTRDIDAAEPPAPDAFVPDAFVPLPDAFVPDAFVPPNLAPNPDLEVDASGWVNNGGGAVLTRSTVEFHTGAASLLVTARSGNWNGPAVDITAAALPGKQFSASVFVHLVNPATETFFLSTRAVCSPNTQTFNDNTDRTPLTLADNATWGMVSSTFTVADATACAVTNYIVYVESNNAATMPDFYVDDISIVETP